MVPNLKRLVSKIVSELVSNQSGHYKCGGKMHGQSIFDLVNDDLWLRFIYTHTESYTIPQSKHNRVTVFEDSQLKSKMAIL